MNVLFSSPLSCIVDMFMYSPISRMAFGNKELRIESHHIMKAGINKDIFEQIRTRPFKKLCFSCYKIFR